MHGDHFKLADDVISHLTPAVAGIRDPFLASRYAGFVVVTAVTVYELAVKEILCAVGESKHSVLGNFARVYFDRINGRIRYKNLHEEYVFSFGDKYVRRFKKAVEEREKELLVSKKRACSRTTTTLLLGATSLRIRDRFQLMLPILKL